MIKVAKRIVWRDAEAVFDRIIKRDTIIGKHRGTNRCSLDSMLSGNSIKSSISVCNYQLKTLSIIVQIQNTPPIRLVHTAIG